MNKLLSTVAISAVLSTGAIAGDIYGSVGAALTTLSAYDSGVSIVGTAGMKLDNILPNFAVEVELSQTVVDPSASWAWSDLDMSIFGVGAYAVYNFKIPNTPITIKPRLGLNYENISYDYANNYSRYRNDIYRWEADYSDTSLSYGLGVTYPLNNKLTVYADYTDKGISDNIGVGIGMSF